MPSLSLSDPLYCQEDNFELQQHQLHHDDDDVLSPSPAAPSDEDWSEVLRSLTSKELKPNPPDFLAGAGAYLRSARTDAVSWVADTAARHSFSALTAVLAVNYLDRCFLPSAAAGGGGGLRLHDDKPWMGRLAAVACLSLAAKVEETSVPLLLDLQAPPAAAEDDGGFVFDCRTVRRMELLVLSALGWRMNPVTPLSFVLHLLLRLHSKDGGGGDGGGRVPALVRRCEAVLLAVIEDWRWVRYPASAWAAASLLHVTGLSSDIVGENAATLEYHETQQLIALLNVPMVKVDECYQLILESMSGGGGYVVGHKRKHSACSVLDYYCAYFPPSPDAVIGSCISCESSSASTSNECWAMWPSSVSSSPENRPFKMPNCIANEALNDGEGIVEDNNIFGSSFMATI